MKNIKISKNILITTVLALVLATILQFVPVSLERVDIESLHENSYQAPCSDYERIMELCYGNGKIDKPEPEECNQSIIADKGIPIRVNKYNYCKNESVTEQKLVAINIIIVTAVLLLAYFLICKLRNIKRRRHKVVVYLALASVLLTLAIYLQKTTIILPRASFGDIQERLDAEHAEKYKSETEYQDHRHQKVIFPIISCPMTTPDPDQGFPYKTTYYPSTICEMYKVEKKHLNILNILILVSASWGGLATLYFSSSKKSKTKK